MKKLWVLAVLALLLVCATAAAEDLGIQIIRPDAERTAMSLEDMQLGTEYALDGYAVVKLREAKIVDSFAQFGEEGDYSVHQKNPYDGKSDTSYATVFAHSESKLQMNSWSYVDAAWMDSGESADFFWLLTDVTNLQKKSVNFVEEATVKVVYQDDYEFNGWIRQIVYDHMEYQNGDRGLSRYGYDKADYPNEIVMNPAMTESVDVMYTGTYAFGCTLPNYVVEDKKSPLRIEISMGGNELTYHIRK